MNTLLLQLTRSSVREPHTQWPREGCYSAPGALTQTGVKPGEKGAAQLRQKWKAALCCSFPQQPVHRKRRTFSVLCRGFCMRCAVNCICFKVWDVSQGENGQAVSPNVHINSKSGSPESSLQAGGPPRPWLPRAHTQSIIEDSRTDHNSETAVENSSRFQKPCSDTHSSAYLHHKPRSCNGYNITTPGHAAIVHLDICIA